MLHVAVVATRRNRAPVRCLINKSTLARRSTRSRQDIYRPAGTGVLRSTDHSRQVLGERAGGDSCDGRPTHPCRRPTCNYSRSRYADRRLSRSISPNAIYSPPRTDGVGVKPHMLLMHGEGRRESDSESERPVRRRTKRRARWPFLAYAAQSRRKI